MVSDVMSKMETPIDEIRLGSNVFASSFHFYYKRKSPLCTFYMYALSFRHRSPFSCNLPPSELCAKYIAKNI